MKKIMFLLIVCFTIMSVNAQKTYIKYEFMKVMPGQDYEKLEKSWENYHKENIKAGIISMHRIWKVLPGNNVDFDYIVSTAYNSYANALGIGKSISVDDFKAKYPEDYQVMVNNTTKARTMVRDVILRMELGLGDKDNVVVPGKSILNMVMVKANNDGTDNYDKAEIEFSKKWHQSFIDQKKKQAFYLSNVVGSRGINSDFTHVISHIYKNIDQMTTNMEDTSFKLPAEDQEKLNKLVSYRSLTKSLMLINVMNIE